MKLPSKPHPKKPGDEIRPQFAWIPIIIAVGYLIYTFTVHDDVVKWLKEHFGDKVAKTYDLAVFALGFVIPSGEIRWEAEIVKDGSRLTKLIIKAKNTAGEVLKTVSFSKGAIDNLAKAGLLQETAENKQIWINLVKYSEKFRLSTDKTARIISKISEKGVKKGYIRAMLRRGTNPKALEKLANEYLPYWRGTVSGVHQIVDVFEAKGITTKVGGHKIQNFAVLKQGNYKFGGIHIFQKHAADFDKVFYTQTGDDIINLIRKTLENPDEVKYLPNEVQVTKKFGLYFENGKAYVREVVVSINKMGV